MFRQETLEFLPRSPSSFQDLGYLLDWPRHFVPG